MTAMDNWTEFSKTMNDFANLGTMDEVDAEYVKRQIAKGTDNPDRQSRIATAVRETVRDYPDSPVNSRGFSLPAAAQAVVDLAIAAVVAMGQAFDSSSTVRALWIPHGKCKFDHFENGEHWATYHSEKIQEAAEAMYKADEWDGSEKSLLATIGGSL
mgnify:FL=1|tara:strand:- start:165 stop:635 length:471 start_codon:yes stop_codon:yes gene_type:complete